ncbi:hypothetical protein GH714_018977 [Hevea brasiliensis]|uniref:Cell number regulator 6 n=1 Tax=Hevea brasiliensis TaxID=3981 RepID=A0A6A6LTS3_HEVBR|nr:hypothetical protein GH714_018977 [Hevea brasiliensis]
MADGNAQSRYVKLTKDQVPTEDITPGELNQPIPVPELIIHRCAECGQALPESYEPPADEDWTTGVAVLILRVRSIPHLRDYIWGIPSDCWNRKLKVVCKTPSWTGLFCPCVLFGHNVETLREDIPWTNACVCHAMCVEGGLALAAATLFFHGIDPKTSFSFARVYYLPGGCVEYTLGCFDNHCRSNIILRIPCDPCMVHCCMHWCALCQEHREMKNHLSENAAMQMTVVNPPPAQQMNSGGSQESASDDQSTRNGAHTNLEIQPL